MPSNKPSFAGCRLYWVLDRSAIGNRDFMAVAEAGLRGGVDLLQWRDKTAADGDYYDAARALRALTRRYGKAFVVNDRIHIAMLVRADGVHLGHQDLPVTAARALAGPSIWIGRSTHSLTEAIQAEAEGADYIGVGPVFATPTKPDYKPVGLELVRQVAESPVKIPWVAIGGIDPENLPLVLSAGATRAAVVRAIAAASDPEAAARRLKEILSP
jgi:thiamine-phosphate pyrophosphorylase